MKKEITYKSKDTITDIHAAIWEPDNIELKGIIQISHGMKEHINIYNSFAELLNKQGYIVCGHDNLGHGDSIIDNDHLGYFAKNDIRNILVDDTYELTKIIKTEYPNLPIILLGYSFGSFVLRNYLPKYHTEIDGAIIMGTGEHSKFKMTYAIAAANIISFYKGGDFYRSKYLENKTIGNYKQYFKTNNPHSWLTKNDEYLENFIKDKKRIFRFTCNAYKGMFDLIKHANDNYKNIRTDFPIFILSGKDDAVGDFGKAPTKVNAYYQKLGLKNIKLRIYNGLRHSLLNEPDNTIVINDLISFINSIQLKKEN